MSTWCIAGWCLFAVSVLVSLGYLIFGAATMETLVEPLRTLAFFAMTIWLIELTDRTQKKNGK